MTYDYEDSIHGDNPIAILSHDQKIISVQQGF